VLNEFLGRDTRVRVAEAGRPVTTRAVLAALVLGIAPITLVRWLLPTATELPQVEIWKPLDIPIAAAALGLWLFAVVSLRLPRIPPRVCRPLALALAAAPTLLSALCLPTTVSNDERAYILQAEMLAAGRLSLPLVEPREALRRRQIHEDPERRRLYSKYPPGTAAALAPGARLGLPAVMVLAAGLLDLLLIAALARQLGLADPWLAALLLASCPLFLLLQTSFQSQVFTLPAALAGYLALLRAREQNGRRFGWGAAAGACSGWIFLTRPLTGLVFAAAMLPGLLVRGPETRAPGLRAVSGAVLGGLPFLALLLLYNRSLTGDALQTPYGAYAAAFSPWDVYPLFRSDYIHAPATAFFQSLFQQLGRWLPALFGILGAAGLGAWGLWRLRRSDGGAGLALLLLLPLAYAFHWYPGHWAYLGPIYGFEALGLMIVAALVLLEDAPEGWSRSLAPLAVAAGVALAIYRFPFIQAEAEQRAAPRTAAVAAGLPEGAVVLLPWFHNPERQERSRMRYTPSRPPFSDVSEIVYLRELGRAAHTRAALDTLGLADRPIFRFLPGLVEGSGHLLPYSR
jgi:hypothetical protein